MANVITTTWMSLFIFSTLFLILYTAEVDAYLFCQYITKMKKKLKILIIRVWRFAVIDLEQTAFTCEGVFPLLYKKINNLL